MILSKILSALVGGMAVITTAFFVPYEYVTLFAIGGILGVMVFKPIDEH
jgi:hypothetical protein